VGIPTSERTAAQARELNIPLATPDEDLRIDLAIDGADEVEKDSLKLIKGRGGAMLREKIVASLSARFIVIVDESKIVNRLGETCAVPVEVLVFGWPATARRLKDLGLTVTPRRNPDGQLFATDSGNYILDCSFTTNDVDALARSLDGTVGVVEHGFFF